MRQELFGIWQLCSYPVFIGAFVVIVLRLLARSHPWTQSLCRIGVLVNGAVLVLGAACLLTFALSRDPNGDSLGLILVGASAGLILLELLVLLALSRPRRPRAPVR